MLSLQQIFKTHQGRPNFLFPSFLREPSLRPFSSLNDLNTHSQKSHGTLYHRPLLGSSSFCRATTKDQTLTHLLLVAGQGPSVTWSNKNGLSSSTLEEEIKKPNNPK